jgi:hypothetical protein
VDTSGTDGNALPVREGNLVTTRWPSGRFFHSRESDKDIVAEYREPLVLYVNEYGPHRPGGRNSFGGAYWDPRVSGSKLFIRTIKMVEVEEELP